MKDSKRNRRNHEAKAQKRAEYYKPRTPPAEPFGGKLVESRIQALADPHGLDRAAQHFEDEANG